MTTDAAHPDFAATAVLTRRDADTGSRLAAILEALTVAEPQVQTNGVLVTDTRDRL